MNDDLLFQCQLNVFVAIILLTEYMGAFKVKNLIILIYVRSIKRSLTGQCKRISHTQSARWQHLSQLKASVIFFLQKNVSCMERNNVYLGLVTPSSG